MKRYDAVVAGGGVIGASIAFELSRAGLQVGVFDAQEPGREASWASAGIISPAPEGPGMIPLVPLSKASAALYPHFIQAVEELSGHQVGYRPDGAMEVIWEGDVREEISTLLAVYHGVGLRAEALTEERARQLEPELTEELRGGILRPDESSVDNRALTQATLEAGRRGGVDIFASNPAAGIWREGGRCKGLLLNNERVEALWTIIAAGCFSARIAGVAPYAPVSPTKGQMVVLRHEKVKIAHVLWSENVYLVPRNDGRILAGSTVERMGFDRTVTAGGMKKIINGAIELVPGLHKARMEETWAGLRPDSPDHLPILGPTDLHGLMIATGHFRSGILLAPLTARLVREWITTKKVSVDWERFSPMRFLESRQTQSAP
jgi:glycine oxidase